METTLNRNWTVDEALTEKTGTKTSEKMLLNSIAVALKKATGEIPRENVDEQVDFHFPIFSSALFVQDLKNYSSKFQKWVGYILHLKENSFKAKLEDINNPGTYEIGEFDLKEVSPDDRSLVSEGATFYWSIGYSMKNGQIVKESLIRFQRLIDWDEEEYDTAADRANHLEEKIQWDQL